MELLDGSKATHTKEPWYDILHPMTSLVFERDKEEVSAKAIRDTVPCCLSNFF